MSVRILAGRAGRLQPLILQEIAQARQAGQRVFLLVPEQFTLLMEPGDHGFPAPAGDA